MSNNLGKLYDESNASAVNNAMKKINAPFYLVCEKRNTKNGNEKYETSWRQVFESCDSDYPNIKAVQESKVRKYLQRFFHDASLTKLLKEPHSYPDSVLNRVQKEQEKKEAEAQRKAEIEAQKRLKNESKKQVNPSIDLTGKSKEYKQGFNDYPKTVNPFRSGSQRYYDWKNGFKRAEKHSLKTQGQTVSKELPVHEDNKQIEFKHFAHTKPYSSEIMNDDFQSFIKANFDSLKKSYNEYKKNNGTLDFVGYAVSKHESQKSFVKHQEEQRNRKPVVENKVEDKSIPIEFTSRDEKAKKAAEQMSEATDLLKRLLGNK